MNRLDKNVKKGSIGGLVTILSSALAAVLVDKLHISSDQLPIITGALTAVFLGVYDAIKHRK